MKGYAAWLAMVAGCLSIVLGAVQSGKLSGLKDLGGPPIPAVGLNSSLPGGPSPWAVVSAGANLTAANLTAATPGTGGGASASLVAPGIALPGWYVYLILGAALLLGLLFLSREGRSASLIGFPTIQEELESETRRVLASWGSELRNAALVRYYSLLRRACEGVGIREAPAETPKEYLERVATELRLSREEAGSFADVFSRARYGLQLSEREGKEASAFMEDFLEVIKERTKHG